MPMSYKQHAMPSNAELINQLTRKRLAEFKSKDSVPSEIAITEPGVITGIKSTSTIYQKTKYVLTPWQQNNADDESDDEASVNSSNNTVDIITCDRAYHSFSWHTTASNIRAAVEYAFPHASSLVGEVNATLGQYHLDAFEDINQGFINHRYFVKKSLLELYQARLAALAKVESLINSQATHEQIDAVLAKYLDEISTLSFVAENNDPDNKLGNLRSDLMADNISPATCFTPAVNGLMQEKKRITAYRAAVKSVSVADLTRATGTSSILSFVREQMFYALNELASLNQDVTFTREFGLSKIALNRGRLHNWILRAKKIVGYDHTVDHHNKVKASHHGQFAYLNENDRVLFDSSQYTLTAQQQQRMLLAISFIEGMNVIDRSDLANPKIRNKDNPQGAPLTVVASTAWAVGKRPVSRALWGLGLLAWRSVFNVLGLSLAVLTQPLKWVGLPEPSQFLDQQATLGTMPLSPGNLSGIDMRQQAHQAYSLRSYVGDALYYIGDHLLDTLKGVAELIVLPLTGIVSDVQNDYADGLVARAPLADILVTAEKELIGINASNQARLHAHGLDSQDASAAPRLSSEIVAVPEYALSDGDWDLVWNVLTDTSSRFIGSALQTLIVEDPRKGALLALAITAAVVNATSLLTPEVSQILTQLAQNVTQTITTAMAESAVPDMVWPIVGGVVSAQLGTMLVELARVQKTAGFDTLWQEKNDQRKEMVMEALRTQLNRVSADEVPKEVPQFVCSQLLSVSSEISNLGLGGKAYDKLRAEINAVGDFRVTLSVDLLPLMNFFLAHRTSLPYLSEKTKHRFMQHIEKHFDYVQAASLKQCLYPKKRHKTLRATLNMFSAYVQLSIRVPLSIISSVLTWSYKPFASACYALAMQSVKDMTSVYRVAQQSFKLAERVAYALVSLVSDVVVNTIFSRLQTLIFNTRSISAGAQSAATFFDLTRDKVRQFISVPGDYATKLVTAPDFVDTRSRVGQSYIAMCGRILEVQREGQKSKETEVSIRSTTMKIENSNSSGESDNSTLWSAPTFNRRAVETSVSPNYEPSFRSRGRMHSNSMNHDTIDNRKIITEESLSEESIATNKKNK